MNFVKIGKRLINLALVTYVQRDAENVLTVNFAGERTGEHGNNGYFKLYDKEADLLEQYLDHHAKKIGRIGG